MVLLAADAEVRETWARNPPGTLRQSNSVAALKETPKSPEARTYSVGQRQGPSDAEAYASSRYQARPVTLFLTMEKPT